MTLTFKIQLRDIKNPPVWRRIEIPAGFTFDKLHEAIQAAFGWWNYHLYQFEKSPFGDGWVVKVPDENDNEFDNVVTDSRKAQVTEFLKKMGTGRFVYVYDFGDSWVHDITLEKTDEGKELTHPVCIGGKGACPPEDCGGAWGYEEIKRLFAEEPDGEETQEYREWMGLAKDEEFDPKHFSIAEVNEALEGIKVVARKKGKKKGKKKEKGVTLLDTMDGLNKGDITDFMDDLLLKVDRRLGLEKLKKYYAETILSHPLYVLNQLPLEDLIIIEKLKEGEDGHNVVYVFSDYRQCLLEWYGMAKRMEDKEGSCYLLFGDDFRDAVVPYIKEVLDHEVVQTRVAIECVVEGLANLYGYVSRRQVMDNLVRFNMAVDMENAEHLMEATERFSLLLRWMNHDLPFLKGRHADDVQVYTSRYGWDIPDDLDYEIEKNGASGMCQRQFNQMEIIAASRSPIPVIPNRMQKEFSRFLGDNFGFNDWEILVICHDMWYRAMHEGDELSDFCSPEQYFIDLEPERLEANESLRQKASVMLSDYLNNMPQWQLKGYTADEVKNKMKKKPGVAPQDAQRYSQVIGKLNSSGITMPILAATKVGRNDPCPCGSGKKYKNCCGKAN